MNSVLMHYRERSRCSGEPGEAFPASATECQPGEEFLLENQAGALLSPRQEGLPAEVVQIRPYITRTLPPLAFASRLVLAGPDFWAGRLRAVRKW
jgi:hypothetical protein